MCPSKGLPKKQSNDVAGTDGVENGGKCVKMKGTQESREGEQSDIHNEKNKFSII